MAHKNPEWSTNTTAYFDLWVKTLHQNCKGQKKCLCHEGAYRLTLGRLECIERGMPDLPPDVEQEVWELAFDIHEYRCHGLPGHRNGSISPTWSDPKDIGCSTLVCDCFEKALDMYSVIKPEPIRITYEDLYYEERVI